MSQSTITMLIVAIILTTGCAITGDSYTDEDTNRTVVVDKTNATTAVDLSGASGELPEIAPYDEPEVPTLETPATE